MTDYLSSTRRSVSWFKQAQDDGRLVVKPPFQRNPVWSDAQKSLLIDTILRGYPIPEIYTQDIVSADGTELHVVVDGQQRIRACLEFVEGRFALSASEVPSWPDVTFDELPAEERKRIYGYNFLARQLPEMAEEELRIIFKRLNRNNVVLNQQELRHATYWGEFISSMQSISEMEYWGHSGVFTVNDVRRMLDVEFISEIAIAHLHGPQNKKGNLDRLYQVYESSFPERQRIESTFRAVLAELESALPEIRSTRWRKKSDFYSLFLVVANHQSSLPLPKSARLRLQKHLLSFADSVDGVLRNSDTKAPVAAKKYAKAVERAASDLANRKARAESLESLLKPVWTSN